MEQLCSLPWRGVLSSSLSVHKLFTSEILRAMGTLTDRVLDPPIIGARGEQRLRFFGSIRVSGVFEFIL